MGYNEDDNGRFCTIDSKFLASFAEEQGLWFETDEQVEAGLAWGKRKAWLLRRVKEAMKSRLTPRQRECVTLYFFKGMTYQEIAQATNTDSSSAFRAVERGVRVLKWACQKRKRKFCDFSSEEFGVPGA